MEKAEIKQQIVAQLQLFMSSVRIDTRETLGFVDECAANIAAAVAANSQHLDEIVQTERRNVAAFVAGKLDDAESRIQSSLFDVLGIVIRAAIAAV